jgi:hypothetical protein
MDGKPEARTVFLSKATLNKAAVYDAVRAFVGAPDSAIVSFRYTNEELTDVTVEWPKA